MDLSGQSVPVKGVLDLTGDSLAMQMNVDVTGMGTPTEMRLVDRTMYVGVPGTTDKFYKVDLDDPNGPLGALGGRRLQQPRPRLHDEPDVSRRSSRRSPTAARRPSAARSSTTTPC